jgi:hypothetical protein
VDFAVPLDSVLGLADAAVGKTFANGSKLQLAVSATSSITPAQPTPSPKAPKPEPKPRADRQAILRNMQMIYIDADNAKEFGGDDMKSVLQSNKSFASLKLRVVDDPKAADAVLIIRHSAGWEFPFELKSPDRTTLLLFGAGRGYDGKTAAANIAIDFIQKTRPYRNK